MDLMQYTEVGYWWGLVESDWIISFLVGGVYGILMGLGLGLKRWWVPVLLVLLPLVLAAASELLPATNNLTFRLFFLGVPALAVIAFTVWLARTH